MGGRQAFRSRVLWALASGLLVFFAVESALARRVGLDLFLPVAGGTFLPGRLARLGACLVLGFALDMTDRGRALLRALDSICERDRGRWAAAAVVTGLFFLWTLHVTVLAYMTIDDVSIMQAVARVPEEGLAAVYNTLAHSAQENTSSISVPLCLLIGQFYRLDPDGYWYLGFHLATLLVSLTVIGRCVLVKTVCRRWSARAGCAIHGLLCGGMFLYAFAKIAFTLTSAVAGSAAAALMLCRHHETRRSGRILCDGLSGALMVLCFMQRRATGYCLLCFWALALAYQALRICLAGREGLKKRAAPLALCALLTLALMGGVFASGRLECDENYRQAEYYRSLVCDHLNDEITYDQYAQVGIPQELAALVHGWCFMDERVTTDMLHSLVDVYSAERQEQTVSLPARAAQILSRLGGYVGGDTQMLLRALCAGALLLACFAAALRFGRRYWPDLLCGLCAAGGGTLLLLYLVRDGRFLLRAFLVVALPAIVMLLLTALSAPEEPGQVSRSRRTAAAALAILCGAGSASLCAWGAYTAPHAAEAVARPEVFAVQRAIESYAAANRDKTIVTNVYDANDAVTDPLHPVDTYPRNLVLWGYCGDLAKSPGERLYADAFFRDDVRFMTDAPSAAVMLLQYLTMDYGPVHAVVTDRLAGGVNIYDISRVAPEEDGYTGWYEQDGMTYYFRDGEALTGRQTIDGESYTFGPVGHESSFSATPTPEGLIYFTDAYSLTDGA